MSEATWPGGRVLSAVRGRVFVFAADAGGRWVERRRCSPGGDPPVDHDRDISRGPSWPSEFIKEFSHDAGQWA